MVSGEAVTDVTREIVAHLSVEHAQGCNSVEV